MQSKTRLSQLALLLLFSASLQFAHADPGQFYLVPGIQWMNFDHTVSLENERGFSAGIGYQFSERWSAELDSFELSPDSSIDGNDVDLDHYRVDLLYDIGGSLGNWQPFVVGGLGNTKFASDNDTMMNFGAGLKLELSDRLEWRTAIRSFRFLGRSQEDGDFGIDSGLVLYLGDRPAPPAPPQEVETIEPEPADADGDGVPDSDDECPDTPRNYAVDERGCPIPVEEVARVELEVNFDLDRSEVRPEYFDEIEEIADFMEQYPDVVAELEGHTDSQGDTDYNQGLSERRADAVRQVMLDRFGVSPDRVTARGYGESQPVASNDTDDGRAQNRRVITVIIKTLQNYQPR